jgi:hypothetical protein
LKDLCGWNKRGLKALLNTVGLKHESKDSIVNKGFMEGYLDTQELYDEFVQYGMDDVNLLSQIPSRMVSFLNQISTDTLKMPREFEFNEENIPTTIGSVVARFLQNFLTSQLCTSLSQNSLDQVAQRKRLEVLKKMISVDRNILTEPTKKRKSNNTKVSDYFNGASVKSIGYLMKNTTGILNTLVQGGRTYNEQYWNYRAKNILDLDLSGCYASAFMGFSYPIGLPSTVILCRSFYEVGRLLYSEKFFKEE